VGIAIKDGKKIQQESTAILSIFIIKKLIKIANVAFYILFYVD